GIAASTAAAVSQPEATAGDSGDNQAAKPKRRHNRTRPHRGWLISVLAVIALVAVVTVVLTRGSKTYLVPKVDRLSQAQAVSRVKAGGLIPDVIYQASSSVRAGLVIRTDPANGGTVSKNSTVLVYVSVGADLPLPNVQLLQLSAAR